MRPEAAWIRRLATRAAGLAAVSSVVVLAVIAATDGGAPWSARLAMWCALLPVSAALGSIAASRISAARGEMRALHAVGVSPARAGRGATLGALMVSALAPILAATPWCDLGALFPRPSSPRAWVSAPGGRMHELTQGLIVDPSGALELLEASPAWAAGLMATPAMEVVAALALAALAAPVWASRPAPAWYKAMVALSSLIALIVAFQLVAAGRSHGWILLIPPAILLADAAIARYRSREAQG